MPTVKENTDAIENFMGGLAETVAKAQICLDKGVLVEPHLSTVTDALNDANAILTPMADFDNAGGLKELQMTINEALTAE